jgi:CubicO group peptidase (beta-lactamase class C family)
MAPVSKLRGGAKRWFLVLLALLLLLLAAAWGTLMHLGIPKNAAGMAAKGVCSAAFVANRPVDKQAVADKLMAEDVLPASPVLGVVKLVVDEKERRVTGTFAGLFPRTAQWLPNRGCVLDGAGSVTSGDSVYYAKPSGEPRPWPDGNGVTPKDQWTPGIDAAALQKVVDQAFVGAGDPKAANTRGLAVLHKNKLLAIKTAPGFEPETPLHGWSMAKTVSAMLFYKASIDNGLPLNTPVVNAFPIGREPAWVAPWRNDARKGIRVSDLLYMRDGLANVETYQPWDQVPKMLWGSTNVAAFAAEAPSEAPPSTRWRYLSQTSNLLAAVTRARFPTDGEYWAYPQRTLFWQIGANSATMETDASGNWVGSSYLWASVGDWARFGQLMLDDGKWGERQIIPAGWLARAKTPSTGGQGQGYGAQVWHYGNPQAGTCKGRGVPEDTLAMGGHWGQVVAMVPSRDTVIVRLGWTFDRSQFDACALIADVLKALPK